MVSYLVCIASVETNMMLIAEAQYLSVSYLPTLSGVELFCCWDISERLTKCNVNAVFVNELNSRVHVLKTHNKSYQAHIKH